MCLNGSICAESIVMGEKSFREVLEANVDWGVRGANLPGCWQDLYESYTFKVLCEGNRHHVTFHNDGNVEVCDHSVSHNVVSVLGKAENECFRVAELLRLARTHNIENDDVSLECFIGLEDKQNFRVRTTMFETLKILVEDALMFWLRSREMPVYKPKVRVVITDYNSKEVSLVGMKLVLGNMTHTRATLFVTPQWYEWVSKGSVVTSNGFYVGKHPDGHIWGNLGVVSASLRNSIVKSVLLKPKETQKIIDGGSDGSDTDTSFLLVSGWGKLVPRKPLVGDVHELKTQRVECHPSIKVPKGSEENIIRKAAQFESFRVEHKTGFLGVLLNWEHDGKYFIISDGSNPQYTLMNEKDALSWVMDTNFYETWSYGNVNVTLPSWNWKMPKWNQLPNNQLHVTAKQLRNTLNFCAEEGLDPDIFTLPIATYKKILYP